MCGVIHLREALVFEGWDTRGETYGIKSKHRSEIVWRIVILERIGSKTELDESSAEKNRRELHLDSERGCINRYTQEAQRSLNTKRREIAKS